MTINIRRAIRTILFCIIIALIILAVSIAFSETEEENSYYKFSFGFLALWGIIELFESKALRSGQFKVLLFAASASLIIICITLFSFKEGQLPLQGLTFLACLLCMYLVVVRKEWTKFELHFFEISIILGAFYLIISYSRNSHIFYQTNSLTIGSFNPQAIGSWAYVYFVCLVFVLDSYINTVKNKYLRGIILLLICIITMCFIRITLETRSRGALVAIVFFIIMRFLPIFRIYKRKIWNVGMAFFPFFVVIISLTLYNLGVMVDQYGVGLLDGREELWMKLLSESSENILFGNYLKMNNYYAHNLFIDHFIRYGIVYTLFYNLSQLFMLKYLGEQQIITRGQYDGIIGFYGAIILSSVEGMIFSTGCGGLYFIVFSLLFFSKDKATSVL